MSESSSRPHGLGFPFGHCLTCIMLLCYFFIPQFIPFLPSEENLNYDYVYASSWVCIGMYGIRICGCGGDYGVASGLFLGMRAEV